MPAGDVHRGRSPVSSVPAARARSIEVRRSSGGPLRDNKSTSWVVSLLLMMLAGACGGDRSEPPNARGEQRRDSSVSVTLSDFAIESQPASVPPGEITFDVRNESGNHDLYVLRTDLAVGNLPEDKPGRLTRSDPASGEIESLDLLERGQQLDPAIEVDKPDLTAPEIEVVGSIEPMEEGGTSSLTLGLRPGHYVLICNLVDFEFDESGEVITQVGDSHYERGMRTDFSVRSS